MVTLSFVLHMISVVLAYFLIKIKWGLNHRIFKKLSKDKRIPRKGDFFIYKIMSIISENENYTVITTNTGYRPRILDYLNKINYKNKFLFVLDMYCISELYDIDFSHKLIKHNIDWVVEIVKKYKEKVNKKIIFVIDAIQEAPSYTHNLKENIDKISKECDIPLSYFLIFSIALHHNKDPVNYATVYDSCFIDNLKRSIHTNLPYKKFISLARMAKEHRQLATVEILDRGLKDDGYISLGTSYFGPPHGNMNFELIPKKYKHLMPMYLDGEVDYIAQHLPTDNRFLSAFINYVQETSFDKQITPTTWNVPLLSEKSMKPFAWGQVPIFLNLPETVNYVREFGFDLFDDIIDHDFYDKEHNPIIRIKKTVDQLEKICQWKIEECQNYKITNMHRFEKNREICLDYVNEKKFDKALSNLQTALDKYNFCDII